MKQLHSDWGDEVQFIDIIVRQAHPGPGVEPYRTFEQKARDAAAYQQIEQITWPVLVDDLAGSVHQAYGGLSDPSYIIDIDGRVAFYNHWNNAPSLHLALEALRAQGWHGIVRGGVERTPHIGAAMTDGWRGLRRGSPQSLIDMELATPGSTVAAWFGYQIRPLIAPLTLKSRPLSVTTSTAMAFGVGIVAGALAARVIGSE